MDSANQHNITFICKIKPNSFSTSTESRSKTNEKRSASPMKSPNKKISYENSQNIFTTISDNETSKIVIANENPIKQKFINSYFRTEKDLFNYRTTILKNARIYNFDGVFDQNYKFFSFFSRKSL